jgi:ADP-heptose:LPS heptosyltransferase
LCFRSAQAGGEFFALRRKLEIKMFDAVWDMAGVLRSGLLTSAVKSL